jgi:predicted  nucleic acid-binding Zn-ribbon protein
LELQALDTGIDRLAARRRTLPDLAAVAELEAKVASSRDEVVRIETELSDIGRVQRKLDNEIDLVRSRADRDRKRLDSGQVASPRELENLQSELASLARRQGALEDDMLEKMETIEGLEAQLKTVSDQRDGLAVELASAQRQRDAALAELDAQVAARRAERDALTPTLPAPVVTLYERIRASSSGVGAAALLRRRCEGCHLELSGADVRAVAAAPADEIVRCEECRRILVRTPESGL